MKISVIIPAYNCGEYICQTLDAIYFQTIPRGDIEIIICLDVPTDNTARLVRQWARAHGDMDVRIISNKTNRGASYSRNVAAAGARGDYIHFMDSDDLINRDFYRSLYDAARATDADVAVASYIHQRRPGSSVILDTSVVVSNAQEKIDLIRVDQHGMMWRYLIRRRFWRRHNFAFPEDMKICEDWVLANKMVFAANHIVLVPDAVYLYRFRDTSLTAMSKKLRDGSPDGLRANVEIVDFFRENGLQRCSKCVSVYEYRLFGKIMLLRKSVIDRYVQWLLFGCVTIFSRTLSYERYRRPLSSYPGAHGAAGRAVP